MPSSRFSPRHMPMLTGPSRPAACPRRRREGRTPAVATATSPAAGVASERGKDARAPAGRRRTRRRPRRHPPARDRPFGPFDPVESPVEDVVEDDAAGVEAGRRDEQPARAPGIAEAGDGVAGQDVGEGGRDIRRSDQLEIATVSMHPVRGFSVTRPDQATGQKTFCISETGASNSCEQRLTFGRGR